MEKSDWKKNEKSLYLPGAKPERITVSRLWFLSLDGRGEPGSADFSARVEALFGLSYAIKMAVKKGTSPFESCDYVVYPLEGIWALEPGATYVEGAPIDKKALTYTLQIRQPAFVTADYVQEVVKRTRAKKPELPLDRVRFEALEEGPCLQMLHKGSFDEEPKSFALLKSHMEAVRLRRHSHSHREIYLSDFRKAAPAALRTVLRVGVVPA
jgi:hypothetical protein